MVYIGDMATKETPEVYRRWDDGFVIRRLRSDEEPPMFTLPDGLVDVQMALAVHRDNTDKATCNFYVGELNGEVIASQVETRIADDLSYYGHFCVAEKYRWSGIANKMNAIVVDISKRRKWTGIEGFDIYQHSKGTYEKLGYKMARETICYEGTVTTSANRDGFRTDITKVG